MSTFFEKLTSAVPATAASRPSIVAGEEEAQARPPRRYIRTAPPKTAAAPRAGHVRDEEEAPRKLTPKTGPEEAVIEAEPAAQEEEGELTVDIYDKGDSIIIQSTVAGVKPEDLDVSITSDTVTIKGKRELEEEVLEKDYYYKELFWGNFSRSVILPEEIDEDEAEATLKNGLLTIRLPKKRRAVVQKVKIKMV